MAKKDLQDYSSEELLQMKKKLSFATGLLAGILIVLFIVAIYDSIEEGEFNVIIVTPIALSTIVLINYQKIKQIKQDLAKRTT